MNKILLVFSACTVSVLLNAQTLPSTYVKTTVINNLQHPADFDWTPDGRYLVTQKGDNTFPASNAFIKIFNSTGTLIGTFYDLSDSVDSDFERGLLGIAVDPAFATNHYVYAYYNYRNPAQNNLAIRVVRFTEVANVGTNPTLILNIVYATSATTYAGNHVGGIIRFRPSEPTKLYVQTGDLAYQSSNPTLNYANKLTNPYGKILRINTNGTIPTDNPYYDDGNPAIGNDDRIWSYGHRNMFGMCFNPVTDSLYSTENGATKWDEFNIIHKGANYGWSTCEGAHLFNSTTSPCTNPAFINPLSTWGNVSGLPALTGCLSYSGSIMPEFNNHILVADNRNGIIYDLTMGNAPAYDVVSNRVNFADITTTSGLTALKQGADGCIYAMKGGYTTSGEVYKICPANVGILRNDAFENDLGQNYPNPSTGKTQINYTVAQVSNIVIELYDVTGRKIKTVLNTNAQVGNYTVSLDDLSGLTAGSYFYKMQLEQNDKTIYSETKRMLLVK
ncbi:MAG: PQQ-dependent sugar dehydrogenase [Bacteroidota bacterium]